jgi:hypothetical protein
MVLEKDIKDRDASIELLERREKNANRMFYLFYVLGAAIVIYGGLFGDYLKSWMVMDYSIGIGITLLFVAAYALIIDSNFRTYIFINHKLEQFKEKEQ